MKLAGYGREWTDNKITKIKIDNPEAKKSTRETNAGARVPPQLGVDRIHQD
jgi:hypothetical protein